MTDLEKFIDLYKSFGIDVKVFKIADSNQRVILGECYGERMVTESDKFKGYNGFYSRLIFSPEGKFIEQGFYE